MICPKCFELEKKVTRTLKKSMFCFFYPPCKQAITKPLASVEDKNKYTGRRRVVRSEGQMFLNEIIRTTLPSLFFGFSLTLLSLPFWMSRVFHTCRPDE